MTSKRIDKTKFSKLLAECGAATDNDGFSAVRYTGRPEVPATAVAPQLAGWAHLVWETSDSNKKAFIYLGPMQAASKDYKDELKKANIRAIVNCTTSLSAFQDDDCMQVCQVPVHDIESANMSLYMPGTCVFLHDQLQRGNSVLVHCAFGVSRSATVVLAYLIQHQNMSLEDAYWHVKSRRPNINPNTGFWSQLQAWESQCREGTVNVLSLPLGKEWAESSLALFSTLHTVQGVEYKDLCFMACRGQATNDILFVVLDHVWGRGVREFAVCWLVELVRYMQQEQMGSVGFADQLLSMLADENSKFVQNWQGEVYPEWIERIRAALGEQGMIRVQNSEKQALATQKST